LATFPVGLAVVEYHRDHDVEHVAEKLDQPPARGLTARQLGAYPLRDRRDAGLHVLAELLDDRAVEAFLAAEVVLDGRQIDAGALGDRACACAVEAARREQVERGFRMRRGFLARGWVPGRKRLTVVDIIASALGGGTWMPTCVGMTFRCHLRSS
jgi:hypothetical protein